MNFLLFLVPFGVLAAIFGLKKSRSARKPQVTPASPQVQQSTAATTQPQETSGGVLALLTAIQDHGLGQHPEAEPEVANYTSERGTQHRGVTFEGVKMRLRQLPAGKPQNAERRGLEGQRLLVELISAENATHMKAGSLVEVDCEGTLYLGEVFSQQGRQLLIGIEHAIDLVALSAIQGGWSSSKGVRAAGTNHPTGERAGERNEAAAEDWERVSHGALS